VWIGIVFSSDDSVNAAEGAYVDDILLRRCVGGTCEARKGSRPAAQFR
jgi:hypothetical protein